MTKTIKYTVPALLLLSAIMLAALIPGGPVETRNFAHIDPVILGGFNAFLTILGLASIFLVYLTFRGQPAAFIAAALCGLGYFLIYVLDLLKIFPVSPDPMPVALWGIEVAGTTVSLPLMVLATMAALHTTGRSDVGNSKITAKVNPWLALPATLIALTIIAFATYSAMHG